MIKITRSSFRKRVSPSFSRMFYPCEPVRSSLQVLIRMWSDHQYTWICIWAEEEWKITGDILWPTSGHASGIKVEEVGGLGGSFYTRGRSSSHVFMSSCWTFSCSLFTSRNWPLTPLSRLVFFLSIFCLCLYDESVHLFFVLAPLYKPGSVQGFFLLQRELFLFLLLIWRSGSRFLWSPETIFDCNKPSIKQVEL